MLSAINAQKNLWLQNVESSNKGSTSFLTGNFWHILFSKMESINCSAMQTECAGQDSGLPTGITFPAMEFQMVYH
ncbi:unnamed protein product [Lathyrus sativus]|nr:unnamed protein product [Lathyrus sativus]